MPAAKAAGQVANADGQMTIGDARTLNDAGTKSKRFNRSRGLDTVVEYRRQASCGNLCGVCRDSGNFRQGEVA